MYEGKAAQKAQVSRSVAWVIFDSGTFYWWRFLAPSNSFGWAREGGFKGFHSCTSFFPLSIA